MSDLSAPLAAPPRTLAVPADIDWRDIPIFIVNRNRCAALQRLVSWLLAGGTRRVVILDNASTYPPLLAYYAALPEGARLMRLDQNFGPYVFWQQGVHQVIDTPYVVTDSDVVPADFCPADLIARLLAVLQRYPEVTKVGPALRIDDIPDGYVEADTVRKWESQFWERPVAPGLFAAPIDTTFALYPPRTEFSNDERSLRLGHPYIVEHTPWYAQEQALSDEERYYREHTSAVFSNWSVEKKDSWVRKSTRVVHFDQRAKLLNLDPRGAPIPGWINAHLPGAGECLPLRNDSLDGLRMNHVLESVSDSRALFEELHRVSKAGAKLQVRVAHGSRAAAWQDAGQCSAWYEGSFAWFAQPVLPAQPGGYAGDWEVRDLRLLAAATGQPEEIVVTLEAIKPARARRGIKPVARSATLTADDRVAPAFTLG